MSPKENFCTSPLLCAAPMEPLRTPDILVNGVAPTGSESFIYLGSAVTNANSWQTWMLRGDPNQVPFEMWEKRLWSCHDIKTATKIKVYNAVVLPTLLYSTETRILHRGYFRKLTKTQLRHLRQVLRIKWEEDVPDVK